MGSDRILSVLIIFVNSVYQSIFFNKFFFFISSFVFRRAPSTQVFSIST